MYEQTFSKNRRPVRQDDTANRKKERERHSRYGEKGIEIGAFTGWQNHAGDGWSSGKSDQNDPHAESAGPAGGHA